MSRLRFASVAFAWIVAAALFFCAEPSWARPEQELSGINNFAKVTDTLYRGAQPSSAGFNALKAMGVTMVVNFRDEASETSIEKREVESLLKSHERAESFIEQPASDVAAELLAGGRIKLAVGQQIYTMRGRSGCFWS